jgi:hypothetical protein
MAANLVGEITAHVVRMPVERQREALALVEQLAARKAATSQPLVPRALRRLKGTTATGNSVSSGEIREARGEMWCTFMGEDEAT